MWKKRRKKTRDRKEKGGGLKRNVRMDELPKKK